MQRMQRQAFVKAWRASRGMGFIGTIPLQGRAPRSHLLAATC